MCFFSRELLLKEEVLSKENNTPLGETKEKEIKDKNE